MQFATCEPIRAAGFIRQMYPDRKVTDECMAEVLAYVEADAIRVQDPDYHRPCQIVAGKNMPGGRDEREAIFAACKRMHRAIVQEARDAD